MALAKAGLVASAGRLHGILLKSEEYLKEMPGIPRALGGQLLAMIDLRSSKPEESDQLTRRFARNHDRRAFSIIMARYGNMVYAARFTHHVSPSCCHTPISALFRKGSSLASVALLLLATASQLPADQVELQNGDRYVGFVLSVSPNGVLLKSDVLGILRLPRTNVAVITFGPVHTTNSPVLPKGTNAEVRKVAAASTNAVLGNALALKGMKVPTNLVQQVQQEFLSDAGPEANAMFNDLFGGLLSGRLNVGDIRAQAKAAADQLRALQRQSGGEGDSLADVYLPILDKFLNDTASLGPATMAPPAAPKPKAKAEQEED
jgi:hypothetical protein